MVVVRTIYLYSYSYRYCTACVRTYTILSIVLCLCTCTMLSYCTYYVPCRAALSYCTYRWKGENVATTEVAEVLAAMPRMFSDVTVYGVSVPHCDGKVGMAAVVLTVSPEGGAAAGAESSVDWPRFHQECVAHLPAYARPAFIRIRPAMQITSTFKHQKGDLVKAGYDLEKVGTDKVYFYSHRDGKISPLTPALLLKIDQGAMKL